MARREDSSRRHSLAYLDDVLSAYQDFGLEYLVVGGGKRDDGFYKLLGALLGTNAVTDFPSPEGDALVRSPAPARIATAPVPAPPRAVPTAPAADTGTSAAPEPGEAAPARAAEAVRPDGSGDVPPFSRETSGRASLQEKEKLMAALRAEIGDCHRCRLHGGRTNIVFGEGDLMADLMFVGEGPGANEDRTGRPFVGPAGNLLDKMITAGMKLERRDVYIANIVKCRPPENRTPEEDESAVCGAFVERQIEIVQPRVVVCLGGTAAKYLLRTKTSIGSLRGRVLRWRSTDVVCTYHPSYLLQNPSAKKLAWEDLQKVMALLGLPQQKGSATVKPPVAPA